MLADASGVLAIIAEERSFTVSLANGHVVDATSPLASDAVVRVARTCALITSTQVAELMRGKADADARDDVTRIAELARLTPAHTQLLRRQVVAQRAARALALDAGEFTFDPAAPIPVARELGPRLDLREVVYVCARRNLSEARLAAELTPLAPRIALIADADQLARFGFGDDERPIVEALRAQGGATRAALESCAPNGDRRIVHAVVYALAAFDGCVARAEPAPLPGIPAVPRPVLARPIATPPGTPPVISIPPIAAKPVPPPRAEPASLPPAEVLVPASPHPAVDQQQLWQGADAVISRPPDRLAVDPDELPAPRPPDGRYAVRKTPVRDTELDFEPVFAKGSHNLRGELAAEPAPPPDGEDPLVGAYYDRAEGGLVLAATTGDGDLTGTTIDNRYVLEGKLGRGRMSVVYQAHHKKLNRMFAVKVLRQRVHASDPLRQRFERQAELTGELRHVNLVGVVDAGTIDDRPYLVMDFADGVSLAEVIADAPLPAERVVRLLQQLCDGLQHAHDHGLIHRDLTPANVIVETSYTVEIPRIVDFGLAILREPDTARRLTADGIVLGTPEYMAPEQALDRPIDHRVDLYALGVITYQLLTGKLPFAGTGAEVARANVRAEVPVMSDRCPGAIVDPLLEALTRKLLAKDPQERPVDAAAVHRLLALTSTDRAAAAAALGIAPAAAPARDTGTQAMWKLTAPARDVPQPAATPPVAATPESPPPPVVPPPEPPPLGKPVVATPAPVRARSEADVPTDAIEPIRSDRWRWLVIVAVTAALLLGALFLVSRCGPGEAPRTSSPSQPAQKR